MLRLGQTVANLARHRRQWQKQMPGHMPGGLGGAPGRGQSASASGRRFAEVADFGSNPGNLRMLTYVPDRVQETPALVVVLHGCKQTAAGYADGVGWPAMADQHGFILLMPEQRQQNNANGCFNWFEPEDTRRDSGECLSIAQMVRRMAADHGVDADRVYVTGLSAGGAMTSVMLATYPDLFAGGAIVAGLPFGSARNVAEAFEAMFQVRNHTGREWGDLVRSASGHKGHWPRVSVWQGSADTTVRPGNADEIVKQWTDLHGLRAVPTLEHRVDGQLHQVWRDSRGEDVLEVFTIAGMAHGAPILPGTEEGQAGTAGAFILDAGISSAHHILAFWGLTDAVPERAARPQAEKREAPAAGPSVSMPSMNDFDPQAVITKALKAAGLM
ncbi:PHB depolymerase family esterase [Azospirillum sp. SYSU D00513]|uniref:extracellular catalytic domain type 1 short-chain-length polyhydroxyalkanoate depolymerase n=1 Tax=Azospirillum sp. SYSU D00513 TaxID=2812561 RepID=UPI001A96CB64|nr:PHB depolymerase family esterase [Azospirillum sp. SYSU D00513]